MLKCRKECLDGFHFSEYQGYIHIILPWHKYRVIVGGCDESWVLVVGTKAIREENEWDINARVDVIPLMYSKFQVETWDDLHLISPPGQRLKFR